MQKERKNVTSGSPLKAISKGFFGGGKAAEQEPVDNQTHRSDPRSTGLNSVEKKCDTSVRKKPLGDPQKPDREQKVLCVDLQPSLLLFYTARTCIHRLVDALAVAPVPSRSLRSVENAQGSPVAERVLSAELRGEINPPEYRCVDKLCGAGFSSAPLPFYFWIIFR